MRWYHLPLSQQKDVAHMLNRIQNGVYCIFTILMLIFLEIFVFFYTFYCPLSFLLSFFYSILTQGPFKALDYDTASTVFQNFLIEFFHLNLNFIEIYFAANQPHLQYHHVIG